MDAVLRAVAVYLVLLVLVRVSGKRTLADVTAFDFVLLLILGEATQQALLGDNFSVTNATIVIGTLVGIDIGLSYLKRASPAADAWLDGVPAVLIHEGRVVESHLRRERVDRDDLLEAAREQQGLASLDDVRFAVLERSGRISIVPFRDQR